jgi:hypothetical protein
MPEQCSLVQALLLSQIVSKLVESHAHYASVAWGCLQWSLCVHACMYAAHECTAAYECTEMCVFKCA